MPICQKCCFQTSSKSAFEAHCRTKLHKFIESGSATFDCEHCTKRYTTRTGLWAHKKKCQHIPTSEPPHPSVNDGTMGAILDTVNALRKEISELRANQAPTVVNNNNTTNNNNINIYLNTTCKDAMTIEQFFATLQINEDDIRALKKRDYADVTTSVIKRHFDSMDVTKRPLHCMPSVILHRPLELYIKDDEWKRESQSDVMYELDWASKYRRYDDEFPKEDTLSTVRFLNMMGDKMVDVYKDLKTKNPELSVDHFMKLESVSSKVDDKINILENLAKTIQNTELA